MSIGNQLPRNPGELEAALPRLAEPMPGLFSSSRRVILDFDYISESTSQHEDVRQFFRQCEQAGINPRLPEQRQAFNDRMSAANQVRYLIGGYGEDRKAMLAGTPIAAEGRTIHLGLDVFASNQEEVLTPCDGQIVRADYEEGPASYGHFLIIRPNDSRLPYVFMGHLASDMLAQRSIIKSGDRIAKLGDFANGENGGWSRHLHLQMLDGMPQPGQTPPGYSSADVLEENSRRFPDPMKFFPGWQV